MLKERQASPHRLRVHPGTGPQAAAAAHEAQQGDDRGLRGREQRALPGRVGKNLGF